MRRFANVATPATAGTVVVPESVTPPGLDPSETVTLPLKQEDTAPEASCASTCTGGRSTPLVVFPGCAANTSVVAAHGPTRELSLPHPPSITDTVAHTPAIADRRSRHRAVATRTERMDSPW